MASTLVQTGQITIGESGAPEVTVPLSTETPAITQQNKTKITIPSGVATAVIPFGNVIKAHAVHIKAYKADDGSAKLVVPIMTCSSAATTNITTVLGGLQTSEFYHAVTVQGGVWIKSMSVASIAGAGDTVVECLVAGIGTTV